MQSFAAFLIGVCPQVLIQSAVLCGAYHGPFFHPQPCAGFRAKRPYPSFPTLRNNLENYPRFVGVTDISIPVFALPPGAIHVARARSTAAPKPQCRFYALRTGPQSFFPGMISSTVG